MSNAKISAAPDSRGGGLLIDCAIAFLAILPLLLTAHLPLTDLPNHLGRQYILRDLAVSPVLQQFYDVRWALIPNLALDIFVTGARALMPIDLAVRLFCILTILMLFFGTRMINRTLGGAQSRIYRVAPLLCYGGPFQYGFLNYCFGIGLALVMFGLYLRLRGGSRLRLMLIFVPLSLALFVCHLSAFGLFAIALGGFELAQSHADAGGRSPRFAALVLARGAVIAAFLAPTLILYKLFAPVAAGPMGVHYNGLQGKADGLVSLFLFSSPVTELPLLALAGLGLLCALFARIVRVNAAALVMAGLFALAWLALPRAMQGGDYVDWRVPWGASFFLLAGLVPGPGIRYRTPLAAAFGVLVLARIALIAAFWISWEPTEAAIDGALSRLPVGARLMTVAGDIGSVTHARRPPLDNVAGYAVARRQAFEANVFADISGQVLYLREPYRDIAMSIAKPQLRELAPEYNYVIVFYPAFAKISPAIPLACVEEGPSFRLFKVAATGHPLSAKERQGQCAS